MAKDLLIIIDPQNDFTHEDGFYANNHPISHIQQVKKNIVDLLKYWNKESVVVVYSNYEFGQFKKGIGFAIKDTFGHQLDEAFMFDNAYTHIAKKEHSAFTANEFKIHVAATQANKLYICGFLAEYCVQQTAIDALANNYEVCLIEDCIGTGDDVLERKKEMLTLLQLKGAQIIDSAALSHQNNNAH